MNGATRHRSASADSHDQFGDSDIEHDDAAASQPGPSRRKGKGKAPKETDRKAQNRIAQREFRQRKQAYIKELEAKVKLYELGRDEQIDRLNEALQTLLDDNDQLRQLLAALGGFIGEGLGGALPKLRTTLSEFEKLVSRSQIDNATDALRLSPNLATSAKNPSNHQNRATPRPSRGVSTIQADYPTEASAALLSQPGPSNYASLPATTAIPISAAPPLHSTLGSSAHPGSSAVGPDPYYALPPVSAPPSYANPLPPPTGCGLVDSPPRGEGDRFGTDVDVDFGRWFLNQIELGNHDVAEEGLIRQSAQPQTSNVVQALQLIAYHMKSKRDYPDYILPPSLRETATQTLVPHSAVFDGIIFPSLRDRLILLKDQYPIAELTQDLIRAIRIHGNDLLLAENWELSEEFLKKYWFVIDEGVLDISNRWRRERQESTLSMKSIVPDMDD
ncbi:uncharacterized protein JCM15063_000906 [Sporobolomyces koalae]|uniref:uncharacterized protein n=1 Tax=Sporobolomyces koalae TaxID=500713 RepID=UPI0031815F74